MNEKILELAGKANIVFTEVGTDEKYFVATEHKMQKFGELVLEKCLQICEDGADTQTTSGGAAELIRLHFALTTTAELESNSLLDSSCDGYWK